jgi:hypothetical protein
MSTDPAAAIQFEEDPVDASASGKPGAASAIPKKKISLVDYFYVKVCIHC